MYEEKQEVLAEYQKSQSNKTRRAAHCSYVKEGALSVITMNALVQKDN